MVQRRHEQKEQTRDAILDAAAAEIAQNGFEGFRIQGVLDRSGASRGGLYHHFTLKEQIAQALADAEADRWPDLSTAALESGRGLSGLGDFYRQAAAVVRDEVRVQAMLRLDVDLGVLAGALVVDSWYETTLRFLQQALADGEVPDAIHLPETAASVTEAVYGACTAPQISAVSGEPEWRVDRLLRTLTSGLHRV